MSAQKPKVFIGSSKESYPIVKVIEEGLQDVGAEVVPWTDPAVFPEGDFILESLLRNVPIFDFAVLVFGRDDLVTSRGEQIEAPRDNVVFEFSNWACS